MKQQPEQRENYWRTDHERPQTRPGVLEYYGGIFGQILVGVGPWMVGFATAYVSARVFGLDEPVSTALAISVVAVVFIALLESARRL